MLSIGVDVIIASHMSLMRADEAGLHTRHQYLESIKCPCVVPVRKAHSFNPFIPNPTTDLCSSKNSAQVLSLGDCKCSESVQHHFLSPPGSGFHFLRIYDVCLTVSAPGGKVPGI